MRMRDFAHQIVMFRHLQYNNKNCVLYPRPLTCQKEFLLFYMCQLWALHVVTKRQFFYINAIGR